MAEWGKKWFMEIGNKIYFILYKSDSITVKLERKIVFEIVSAFQEKVVFVFFAVFVKSK